MDVYPEHFERTIFRRALQSFLGVTVTNSFRSEHILEKSLPYNFQVKQNPTSNVFTYDC